MLALLTQPAINLKLINIKMTISTATLIAQLTHYDRQYHQKNTPELSFARADVRLKRGGR